VRPFAGPPEGNHLRNDCSERKVQIAALRLPSTIEIYFLGFLYAIEKIQYCLKRYLFDRGKQYFAFIKGHQWESASSIFLEIILYIFLKLSIFVHMQQ